MRRRELLPERQHHQRPDGGLPCEGVQHPAPVRRVSSFRKGYGGGHPAAPVFFALLSLPAMFGPRARGSGLLVAALLGGAASSRAQDRSSLVLITLDTTRSDYVGRVEAGKPVTPNLDRLARTGVRFTRALTASPLTLPAHCSLMTGVNPPAHGVRDNGASALPADVPTLSSALSSKGYSTAAFVASRVLDRRFGLDRGVACYDDAMTAEEVGEQGYPERRATAVTDAALAWAKGMPASKPFFLWVHYYDAHAHYAPPGVRKGCPAITRYTW